jgi:hypothetical protein
MLASRRGQSPARFYDVDVPGYKGLPTPQWQHHPLTRMPRDHAILALPSPRSPAGNIVKPSCGTFRQM